MVRKTAIIPIFLAIAGFVLSLLVLLAGRNENFLSNVYIIKIDTSQLGSTIADIDTSGVNSILDRLGLGDTSLGDTISNYTSKFEDKIEEIGEDLIDTSASRLGIRDVYVTHVMTYCEGLITGDETNNHTTITNCTDPKIPFSFDPIEKLETQLRDDVTLEQLGVSTDSIEDVINTLQVAYKVMSVCYVVGVALAGFSILLGFAGLMGSRVLAFFNGIIAWLAFLVLGVASGIATAIAVKGRDVFNDYARDAGVVASESKPMMGMTWASVAAMFIAALIWSFMCCFRRKDRRADKTTRGMRHSTESNTGMVEKGDGTRPSFMSRFRRRPREPVV